MTSVNLIKDRCILGKIDKISIFFKLGSVFDIKNSLNNP